MKFKLDAKVLLTEIITIVIGILLALAANEWNNQRIADNKADMTLHMVTEEVGSNFAVLQRIHAQNQQVLDSIANSDSEETTQFLPGIQIRDTAWQTLLSSGIAENVEIGLLQALHDHYAVLNMYKQLSYQTLNTILSTQALVMGMTKNVEQAKSNDIFEDNIKLLVMVESALLTNTQSTLDSLKQFSH
ncbi:hypothetical protein P2G88_16240 [Aliiglaciecola sp. CAU 1673]|uniref:hypothetical protein n=1 Tax=Aliiglaciecola sp. CAU 1673 TaxID=3032595 RepID=UPI0023DA02B9|nr:hypothetical protein [Aliiglaciecola sp. CAU 1673]MDF2179802.1 hypothetical protein [Aliiglaciecola sp. CAU 1673]